MPLALISDQALKLEVRVLDADAGAVELTASAATGDCLPNPTPNPICVFRGLFTSESLAAAAESCMYVGLDQAQQLGSVGSAQVLQLDELMLKGD